MSRYAHRHRKVRAQEAVAAAHVVVKVGQKPAYLQLHLRLSLDHLEEQTQLRHLYSLRVQVDAVYKRMRLRSWLRTRTSPLGLFSRNRLASTGLSA